MSSSCIEQLRATLAEAEVSERLAARDLRRNPTKHRHALAQQHRVAGFVEGVAAAASVAVETYADADNSLRDERQALSDNAGRGFDSFYSRLGDAREHHRRFGDSIVEADNADQRLTEEPRVEFSGEEQGGRYLDLHGVYKQWLNSKFGCKSVDYADWLQRMVGEKGSGAASLARRAEKSSPAYHALVLQLCETLESFHRRTQPLQNAASALGEASKAFERRWTAGEAEGWEAAGKIECPIDTDEHSTVEALVELGGDALKEALTVVGLKSGGTPQQRAERLLLLKNPKGLAGVDRKHLAKGSAVTTDAKAEAKFRAAAALEARAACVMGLLGDVMTNTLSNVEKKATRTYEELERERQAGDEEMAEEAMDANAEGDTDSEDDANEAEIYNPLKLPLGWDGKPIPYWLYKLHGLNQEHKCELCGDYSYWGPRAFERHFNEGRHKEGLRRLDIGWSKEYFGVTTIAEAQRLNVELTDRKKQGWTPEMMEEMEDKDGNVYSKKTFMDLYKQGIIGL